MSNHTDTSSEHTPKPSHGKKRSFWRGVGQFIVRLYALAIMVVVLWTGYTAVKYLADYVFTPVRVPEGFIDWQVTTDADELLTGRSQTTSSDTRDARAPLPHYHQITGWFQQDRHETCLTEGCHLPLPHTRNKAIRAFANFHTTFATCGICHDASAVEATSVVWTNNDTGQVQQPPAVLQLQTMFENNADLIADAPSEVHPRMVALLQQMSASMPEDSLVKFLRIQIDTSQPGSPVWRQAVRELESELPNQARGQYPAKLTYAPGRQRPSWPVNDHARLTRTYLDDNTSPQDRTQALNDLHAPVLPSPNACMKCHSQDGTTIDLEKAGYPSSRVQVLSSSPIASMMQQIRQGTPFYLPTFLEVEDAQ